jgi:hypothetical protein
MKRLDDWQSRLYVYLEACEAKPFRYGQFDCCLFACGAVEAMTGVDLAAPFRGRYGTRANARKALGQYGGFPASLEKAMDRAAHDHGMAEVSVNFAGRGDLVLIPRSQDFALGLAYGADILVPSYRGYLDIPLQSASRAWRTA